MCKIHYEVICISIWYCKNSFKIPHRWWHRNFTHRRHSQIRYMLSFKMLWSVRFFLNKCFFYSARMHYIYPKWQNRHGNIFKYKTNLKCSISQYYCFNHIFAKYRIFGKHRTLLSKILKKILVTPNLYKPLCMIFVALFSLLKIALQKSRLWKM